MLNDEEEPAEPILAFKQTAEDLTLPNLNPWVRRTLDNMKVPTGILPWKSKSGHLNAIHLPHMKASFLFDTNCTTTVHLIDDSGLGGYTIMDDSDRELSRHLEAIKAAHGNVLKTGLGFGCFVRACLAKTDRTGKPEVTHIDVIELDPEIAEHFGREFVGNPRVTIHVMDAFDFDLTPYSKKHWDLVWHDIYCDGNDGLQSLHTKLILKFRRYARLQGAWALPRFIHRISTMRFVGLPRPRVPVVDGLSKPIRKRYHTIPQLVKLED